MNYVGFTLTIALILVGILFQRQDARELRKEMAELRKDMTAMRIELLKEIADLRVMLEREFVRKVQ